MISIEIVNGKCNGFPDYGLMHVMDVLLHQEQRKLESIIRHVMKCKKIRKQHWHKEDDSVGSGNFGMVVQKGFRQVPCCHPNENITIGGNSRNEVMDILGPVIVREFKTHFPGG